MVDYLPPGGTEWQTIVDEDEKQRNLLAARNLLKRSDVRVQLLQRRLRLKRDRETRFEQEMAAAVGAWDRWAAVTGEQALHRTVERAEEAIQKTGEKAAAIIDALAEKFKPRR